jgi:hypothetical protein
MFLFKEAARLATQSTPKDRVTSARSHIGIARCRRELTFRQPSSYGALKSHLNEARTHLHQAYDDAVRMDSQPLKLRVELELAVIAARQLQIDEMESRLEISAASTERESVIEDLARVIQACTAAGREDLRDYGMKWLVKLDA